MKAAGTRFTVPYIRLPVLARDSELQARYRDSLIKRDTVRAPLQLVVFVGCRRGAGERRWQVGADPVDQRDRVHRASLASTVVSSGPPRGFRWKGKKPPAPRPGRRCRFGRPRRAGTTGRRGSGTGARAPGSRPWRTPRRGGRAGARPTGRSAQSGCTARTAPARGPQTQGGGRGGWISRGTRDIALPVDIPRARQRRRPTACCWSGPGPGTRGGQCPSPWTGRRPEQTG